MNSRNGNSVTRLAAPFRLFMQRFFLLLLVSAAIGIMLLGRADSVMVERASIVVIDLFSPVMDVVSRPAASVNEAIRSIEEFADIYAENERLRRDNENLKAWQATARALAAQNQSLKALLAFKPEEGARFLSARVVGDSGGAFVRSAIINAGHRQGIQKGQAVLTGDGLAGRVVTAGLQSARVLLITDINSRVPVVVESSRDRAILSGNNSSQPRLNFLPANAAVQEGDRVVTSGHGGVFPPGLPVGRIVNAGDGVVRINPFARLDRLEFVRVVDYAGVKAPDLAPPSDIVRR